MIDTVLHVVDRFIIHFSSSPGLLLMSSVLWRTASRKNRQSKFFPRSMEQTLVYASVSTFALTTLREAFDVAHGQPLFKAPIDYASWAIGLGVGVWALYRWHYFSWD